MTDTVVHIKGFVFSALETGAPTKCMVNQAFFCPIMRCVKAIFFWKWYVVCKKTYSVGLKLTKMLEKQLLVILNTFLRISEATTFPLSCLHLISGKKSCFFDFPSGLKCFWCLVSSWFAHLASNMSLFTISRKKIFSSWFCIFQVPENIQHTR